MKTFEKIYNVVASIPEGKVLTYKDVAILSGVLNCKIVGFALHSNKHPELIPCHRVVNKEGKIAISYAFGGEKVQRQKLLNEGISFLNSSTVDLSRNRLKIYGSKKNKKN